MSKFYLLRKNDEKKTRDEATLLMELQRSIPDVHVAAALIIDVPPDLDWLIGEMGGIALVYELLELHESTPQKPEKRIRKASPTGTCSQCKGDWPLTKEGICKPCAMRNAKTRKNGNEIFGSQEKKINTGTRTEPSFIHRDGSIHGKKLG